MGGHKRHAPHINLENTYLTSNWDISHSINVAMVLYVSKISYVRHLSTAQLFLVKRVTNINLKKQDFGSIRTRTNIFSCKSSYLSVIYIIPNGSELFSNGPECIVFYI